MGDTLGTGTCSDFQGGILSFQSQYVVKYPVSGGCPCGGFRFRIWKQLGPEIRFVRLLCFG